MNGERNAIDQAVRHLDWMDGERAQLDAFVRAHLAEVGVVEQAVLVEFVFDVGEGEFGSVDRDVQFRKYPGQGTDVVFMTVRKNDAANALAIFDEIRNVWDDDVYTEQLGLGEHKASIDDEDVVTPAEGHAVHAELAEAS